MQLGTEEVQRGPEVGLVAPAFDPVLQVEHHLGEVVLLVRKAGDQIGDGLRHRDHERPDLADVVRVEVDLALGLLQEPQRVGGGLEAQPRRVLRGLRDDRGRVRTERAEAGPVHEVQPQLPVVTSHEVVVAEEVRVGDDHDAAVFVRHRREQPGPGRVGGLAGAQHDGAGAIGGQRPGTIEADVVDAVQDPRGRRVGSRLADDPGRNTVAGAVVEDDGVLEAYAERRQQFIEVAAVLVLLFLAEDDEPPAAGHERLDGADLGRGEARRVLAHRPLPLGVAGVGDHEHSGARQCYLVERAADGRGDLEVPSGELGRSCGVG